MTDAKRLWRIAWLAERAYLWPPHRTYTVVQQIAKLAKAEPGRALTA